MIEGGSVLGQTGDNYQGNRDSLVQRGNGVHDVIVQGGRCNLSKAL